MKKLLKKAAMRIFKLTDTDFPTWGTQSTYTGTNISAESAMYVVSYMRAIRLISETIATLNLPLYKKTERGRVKAKDHPLYYKLTGKPNRYETSLDFIEAITMSICIFEASYIKTDRFGKTANLYCLHPDSVELMTDRDEPYYRVYEEGQQNEYSYDEIIKIKSFGGIGSLTGSSTAQYGKQALALSVAAEEFGARFFGQGGRPGGILSTDKVLTKAQREDLRKSLEPFLNPSKENQGRLALLEANIKYMAIHGSNTEAQMLELRNHQVQEVARIFGIPLTFMMTTSNTTYNNTEQEFKHLLSMVLRPYMKRITIGLNNELLNDEDRKTHYWEFNTSELLQPDTETRYKVYGIGRQYGFITSEEIREKENMPYIEGSHKLDQPLNSNISKENDKEKVKEDAQN